MAFRTLELSVLVIVASLVSVQGALGLTAAAAAAHLRGPQRQLQAANAAGVILEPRVNVQGRGMVHICTAQKSRDGGWIVGQDAALLAWLQASGPQSQAEVDAIDYCSGTGSSNSLPCWAGDGVYTGKVFVRLSCSTKARCTTNADGSMACVGRR